MVDLVSVSFVKSLGLKPYIKHQYVAPILEGVRETYPLTYSFFYLRITLTNCFNRSFDYIYPFLAID